MLCSKCSWVNKAQDLRCKACGVALYRPTKPYVDSSLSPTIPNHPVPTTHVASAPSQYYNLNPTPRQPSIPTPESLPYAFRSQSMAPSQPAAKDIDEGTRYDSNYVRP
jgi:hypothetical protein